jgi:hypothetical protein
VNGRRRFDKASNNADRLTLGRLRQISPQSFSCSVQHEIFPEYGRDEPIHLSVLDPIRR